MAYNDVIALLFSSSTAVLDAVHHLSVLLAFTVLLNSVQPVLSGKPDCRIRMKMTSSHEQGKPMQGWRFGPAQNETNAADH
ncbi:hypothetical protein GUJ93_ZPchr0010g9990 [Zizania palustris]|uniref:Uncharacterized protein n=1 Tax=Zizania palustris TaxID=103762 RepID=A0A8J5W7U2_ZIZPA|nr:hypothetical protein GUJ93_ZPchr0010g9990 [Zizania palustris]